MAKKILLYKNLPKKSLGGWASEKLGIGKNTILGKTLGFAGDMATMTADNTLSVFGANNVINDNSYSTKFGRKASDISGKVYSAVSPTVANILLPGSGAALSGVQKAIGSSVGNPDDALTQEQIARNNQIAGMQASNNASNNVYSTTFADGGDLKSNENSSSSDADYLKFQKDVQNDSYDKEHAELNYYKSQLDSKLKEKDKNFDIYVKSSPESIKDSINYANNLYKDGKTSVALKSDEIKNVLGDKYDRFMQLKNSYEQKFGVEPGDDYGYRNSLMIKAARHANTVYDNGKQKAQYNADIIYDPTDTNNPYKYNFSVVPAKLAYGGNIETAQPMTNQPQIIGGDAIKYANKGMTHEENPLGGYPVDQNGNMDQTNPVGTVEKGEVVKDGYVFSNRLTIPGKKSTFAYLATRYKNELDETINDPLRKKVIDEKFENLKTKQEELKVVSDFAKSMGDKGKFNSEKTYQKWLGYATKAAENKQIEQRQRQTQFQPELKNGGALPKYDGTQPWKNQLTDAAPYSIKEPLYTSIVPAAANLISGIVTDRVLAKQGNSKLSYTPYNPELVNLSQAKNQAKDGSAFTEAKMRYAAKNAGLNAAQYTQLVNEGSIDSQRELNRNLAGLSTTEEIANTQAKNEAGQFNVQSQFKVDVINQETKNNARLARIQNLRNTLQGIVTPELQRRATESAANLQLAGAQLGSKDMILITNPITGKPQVISREKAKELGMDV